MLASEGRAMKLQRLGTTDVAISPIGLGGAWLGHDVDDAAEVARAVSVLEAVIDCGVNWVDTSENYWDTHNEEVVGVALKSLPSSFLVCSKVAPTAIHSGGASGFRPDQVRQACENSLRRLGRDHLDLYLLHWPDRSGAVPLADTWGAMAGLVDAGWVRSIGLSNYSQADVAACHGQRHVDVVQDGLSVIDHLENRSLFASCVEQGIAVTIFEPLASGLLSDTPFDVVRQRWVNSPWVDVTVYPELMCEENAGPVTQIVDGLRGIGEELGATVSQVAIAWVLRQQGVTSALVGSSSPDRARSSALAGDLELPDDALRLIEEQLVALTAQFADRS